jgi:DNA (cytosine-5)-methyltransferase 1
MALRSLALCAGIGGLDLGVRACRPDHALVGVVERQAYCAAVLVGRMAEQALDQAPIWDDLATFDARTWRGAVDLVTAGFPCQPVSLAGQRRGQDDERWLWPEVWRITRECGARLLFIENVPGLRSLGLADILADLAACGWSAEWDCVPASAVGAPHGRDRLFILAADPDGAGLPELGIDVMHDGIRPPRGDNTDGCSGAPEGPTRRGPIRHPWGPAPVAVVRRVDDGASDELDGDPWADRIHALGNSVVPAAAAFAWRALSARLCSRNIEP